MGAFSHLTRRKFLKSAAAGAGAVAANKMLPSDLSAGGHQKIMPPNGRFKDIELTYFQDNNWLHAPLWLSPIFQKDAGVSIKSRAQRVTTAAISREDHRATAAAVSISF